MKQLPKLAALFIATSAGAIGLLLNSCAPVQRSVLVPLQIEGATFVGNKACQECHAKLTRIFPASPHARLHLQSGREQNGCEACHGPGSKHVASGGGRGKFIINPERNSEACFRCHLQEQAEFHFPQHHPVLEGKMNCVQCHDPHGQDIMKPAGGLAMARLNQTCAQCHREQTKPVIFEHAALREGCTVCHSPHGSVNAKLLTERDANLCLKCHAQVHRPGTLGNLFIGNVNHSTFVRYGSCWVSGCHTAIHGSNVQPYYFY